MVNNQKILTGSRHAVLGAIFKGPFDYRVIFPDSDRAKEFSDSQGESPESYLDLWLTKKNPTSRHQHTSATKTPQFPPLTPALGKSMLAELKRSQIVEMCGKTSISAKAVRNRLSILRSAVSDAAQDDLTQISPIYV